MTRVQKGLLGLAAVVTLLHVVGAFLPGPTNWAFHFYAFLPRVLLVVFGGLAVLSFLPPVQAALARLLAPLARALEGPGARAVALGALAVLLAAFWFGRTRVLLLSDSQFLLKSVQQGAVLFTADTLPATLQLYASYLMKQVLHVTSETASFRVLSFGCGLIWLGALFATVGRLTRSGWARLLMGGLLALAGVTRLFYGYPETSPLLAAGVAVYLWTAVRLLQERKGLVAATAALLLVAALHLTGFLLVPSYVYLLYVWAAGRPERRAPAAGLVTLPVVGYLAYWIARGGNFRHVADSYGPYLSQFIPLAGPLNAKQAYTQLSPARWFDYFNEQLLLGPLALVALVVVLALAGRRAWGPAGGGKIVRFLTWMLVPLVTLSLVFRRDIGGSRDWDLFANVAVPALLLVTLALIGPAAARPAPAPGTTPAAPDEAPAPTGAGAGGRAGGDVRPGALPRGAERALPGLTATLLAVALFQQVGWVLVDTRADTGLERFRLLMSEGAAISPWARSYGLTDLSHYYLDHDAPQEAVTQLEEAVRLSPGNSFAAASLGALYLDAGRAPEALPLMRQAVRLRPDVAVNQYNLGGALARNGQLDSAVVAYAESIRLNARFMQAYQNMGLVLATLGRRAAADSIWRAGLKLFPNEAGLYNNIGTNEEAMGQTERALQSYQTALKLHADDGNVIFNLARVLQKAGRLPEAQEQLEHLAQLEPQNGEVSVNLGLIYEQQGRVEDAMKAYGHAMAVSPRLPPAYLNLARLMVGRKDESGAIQVLETFLENDPENAKKVGVEQFLQQMRQKAAADSAGTAR